jgi:hypothetical protein
MKTKLPDDQVTLKLSTCPHCKGMVRVAVEHLMDKKAKSEFLDEVMFYNLSVKEMSLLEYRRNIPDFCQCKLNAA